MYSSGSFLTEQGLMDAVSVPLQQICHNSTSLNLWAWRESYAAYTGTTDLEDNGKMLKEHSK